MTKVLYYPLLTQLFSYSVRGSVLSRNVLSVCIKRMTTKKTYGNRKFYALPDEYPLRGTKVRAGYGTKKNEDAAKLIKYIDDYVIGKNTTFSGPYGRRKGMSLYDFMLLLVNCIVSFVSEGGRKVRFVHTTRLNMCTYICYLIKECECIRLSQVKLSSYCKGIPSCKVGDCDVLCYM